MVQYKHTQIGYVLLATLGGSALLVAFLVLAYEFNWIAFIVLVILVGCVWLFGSLTVEINDTRLEARFGPGVIRKKFLLADIETCRTVKNRWYYGWGIRLTLVC